MVRHALSIAEIRVRINPRDRAGDSPVAAWASFVVNDGLYLNNVAIRRHPGGRLSLVYPTADTPAGKHTYFKPITKEAADVIEAAVLDAYHQEVGRA